MQIHVAGDCFLCIFDENYAGYTVDKEIYTDYGLEKRPNAGKGKRK